MYVYLSALGRVKGRRGRWVEVDVSELPLYQLYEQYTRVWLILTHTALDDTLPPDSEIPKVSLDMDLMRYKLSLSSLTVNEWLVENDNGSLPTINDIPELNNVTVGYNDAWRAGYEVEPVKPGVHPEAYFPQSEKTDLLLTKEGLDYQHFYDNCLVSVNGFIHQTSYSVHGIYVTDGATSGRIANKNQVGITSFEKIGKITPVPITDDMIYKPHNEAKMKDGAYINLNRDLTGKTVLLILGGYLHVLDRTYKFVGDSLVKIDFSSYPLPQRLFESKNFIDLGPLEIPEYDHNPTIVAVEEIYSDEMLTAYLKLSQTFFLIVDSEDLYIEKHQLEQARLPGRWYCGIEPKYPLLKGNGKLEDYVWFKEENRFVVACDDNMEINYNFETTQWKDDLAVDATKISTKPRNYSRGYLLEIGKDI